MTRCWLSSCHVVGLAFRARIEHAGDARHEHVDRDRIQAATRDDDIGVTGVNLGSEPALNLVQDRTTAFYYNYATGFVGRIVQSTGEDNTIYVTFRGTDMAGSLSQFISAYHGYTPSTGIVDLGDFTYAKNYGDSALNNPTRCSGRN